MVNTKTYFILHPFLITATSQQRAPFLSSWSLLWLRGLTVLMILSVQDICVHTFLGGGGGACTALVFLSASLPEALSYLT